jgi:hypothetical protein
MMKAEAFACVCIHQNISLVSCIPTKYIMSERSCDTNAARKAAINQRRVQLLYSEYNMSECQPRHQRCMY